jgi:hypothetical protein
MPGKDAIRVSAFVSVAATTSLLLSPSSSATPTSGLYRPTGWASSANRSQGPGVLELAPMSIQSSAQTIHPIEPPAWLAQAKERLGVLGHLPVNWGCSEKPSELALSVTWSIVQSMERRGHRLLAIAPMADGGIAIIYAEDVQSAHFDVYNEGGIVVVTRAGRGAPAQYVDLPEVEAVAELSRFLEHDDDAASAG